MTLALDSIAGPEAVAQAPRSRLVWLLVLCIGFNFILALVNAHLRPISSAEVQIVQLAVTALAAFILLRNGGVRVRPTFFPLIALFVFVFMISAAVTGQFDAKALYDMLMLCIFIALGSTVREVRMSEFNLIVLLVAAVAVFEFVLPDLYVNVVNPLSYYANTREWVAAQLAGGVSDPGLYIGSVRTGGDSWLGISLEGHRVGGIFLEPLSLGYFAAIMTMVYCAYYRDHFLKRSAAVALCLLLALMSDTRLAVSMIVVMYAATPILRRLPAGLAYFVPAGAILLSTVIYVLFFEGREVSELLIRLAVTFDVLLQAPAWQYLFGGFDTSYAVDAGILYLMAHGGVAGLLLFFVLASGQASSPKRDALMIFLAIVYLFAAALFTAAFVTIKTAALFGFIVGAAGTGAFAPKPREAAPPVPAAAAVPA